jgi:glyoxylate/hydroxypyruvate reductase A
MAVMFYSEPDDPLEWYRALAEHIPDLDFRTWPEVGDVSEVEVALVWLPPEGELRRYPNLKAILSLAAGVDALVSDHSLPPGVPIARLIDPGLTRTMTEFVLLSVLRHHRHIDAFERRQREGQWVYELPPDVTERRVGVIGLGVLGGEAAAALRDHGFRVTGWSRSAKDLDGLECFHGEDGLAPFLGRTEILVCLLPLTPATENILGAGLFAALPEGAYVVNVARGRHLVEEDLLAALASGHISGATLDVFRDEPLPAGHPFWSHPKVLVTPHIAAAGNPRTAAPQMAENIRRAVAGEPLLDVVDVGVGY